MKKEYNENTKNQAPTTKRPRRTPEELYNRTREERSISYGTRRWGVIRKQRELAEEGMTARNGKAFNISIKVTPCNNRLAYKEDIYINNNPERVKNFPEKQTRWEKNLGMTTLIVEKIERTPPTGRAAPPLREEKHQERHGVIKDFRDFKPWDWKAWRRNRALKHQAHMQSIVTDINRKKSAEWKKLDRVDWSSIPSGKSSNQDNPNHVVLLH